MVQIHEGGRTKSERIDELEEDTNQAFCEWLIDQSMDLSRMQLEEN